MQPSLFPQIDQVRRRLGRRRLAASTCWALATTIAAVLALGGLDRALLIQDLPGRVLLSALSAGVAITILCQWFRAITTRNMSALKIALAVERRYPELRDIVTSALDFSTQEADDPTAGSASLRRAVVLRAATAVEDVDWRQFVPLRPLQRAALACAGVLVMLASLTWWTPQAVGTGLVRLVNPFSPVERPREIVDAPARKVSTQATRPLAIEVPPDKAPQVSFLEPTAEQLTLVPWATLPLVIEARDDLAVENIKLVVRRSDRSEQGDEVFPLWQVPDVDAPQRHRLEYLWQLAPLDLRTGSVVEVHARASDCFPMTGQTLYPLRIAIVTEADLLRELGEREAVLLDIVERTLHQQRELHARTADWAEQPEWSHEKLANESHAVLFGQRQIADALAGDIDGATDSVARSVEFMLRTLSRNHLNRPEFSDRLHALRDWLGELADGPLPQIDESLGNLARLTQRGDSPVAESELRPLVAVTVDRQEQVIATLKRALDSLSVGNAMGRIERQLAALNDDQRRLAEHCRKLFLDWLSDPPTVGDRELEPAASGQRQLARRLAELTVHMATLSDELADSQPQLAARLSDVATLARELGLQMTMRSAAEQLAQRRFSGATSLQRQAVDDLRRLYDRLTRRHAAVGMQQGGRSGEQSEQSSPPKPGVSQPGTSPATSASPTTSQSGDLAASLESASELVRDLWGHLPERQRQQILQPLSEDFLPKYATEIEEYFRALADPDRRPPELP